MSTTFANQGSKDVLIDQTSKDIVDGFIRKTQQQLPSNNSFYNIPKLINNLCLSFYFIRCKFNQNKNQYGFDMEFEDNTIVRNTTTNWRTATILPSISTDCALFKLEITLKALQNGQSYSYIKYNNHFYFGYITTDINNNNIKNALTWNNWLRYDKNRQYSVGMKIQRNQIVIDQDTDKYATPKKIMSPLNRNFKPGDTCMLIVDFINHKCTLKVNHYDIITLPLKTNIVIPAVSLYWKGTEIEITSYSFE